MKSYKERASLVDLKDDAVSQFGHSNVVFSLFFSKEHKKVLPINHQKKCLMNGICGTFDIKSIILAL